MPLPPPDLSGLNVKQRWQALMPCEHDDNLFWTLM